jgi:hypothetical protein
LAGYKGEGGGSYREGVELGKGGNEGGEAGGGRGEACSSGEVVEGSDVDGESGKLGRG